MAELVDALVSGTSDSNIVEVQVLSSAPKKNARLIGWVFCLAKFDIPDHM